MPRPRRQVWAGLGGWLLGLLLSLMLTGLGQATELTLEQALELALKNHPAIAEFRERTAAARAGVRMSQSRYFPQISFNSDYFYGNAFTSSVIPADLASAGPAGAFTGISRNSDYFRHRFTATQLLFDFGRTPGTVGQAQASYDMSRMDLEQVRQQVVLEVRTAFYGYLAARAAVRVSEENVRLNQELVRQATGFYQVGVRARIDVTKAEANLYQAEAQLIAARNTLQLARVALMTALGLKTWPFQEVSQQLEVRLPSLSLEEAKEYAFRQRPELQRNQYQQELQKQALQVARAGYFPTLNAQATYGWLGREYPLRENWFVGVSLSLPLFEGGATRYSVQQARANLKASEENAAVLGLNVIKEVEQAYLDMQSAAEQVRAMTKAVEAAQENWRLAQGRYKAGVGSIIEVTDAQVQFYRAELDLIRAKYDFKVAEARFDKAIGRPF